MTLHRFASRLALVAGLMCLFGVPAVFAEEEEARAATPAAAESKAEESAAKRSEKSSPRTPSKPGGESDAKGKSETKGKADGEKSGDDKKKDASDQPKVVQRPTKPDHPADPQELAVRPDAEGRLRLNFTGQPWEDVLVWLADISQLSLDWQELPGDYLNLRTQQSHTVAEVRDLINRHLLARGFTLLRNGEVLSVVNLKKLDPSLVPSVRPEELHERDPHEFVRVTFPLDWLLADKAVEEFKPLLSPNGQLAKLGATNRLQATDAVVNLRTIYRVLQEEQSGQGQERLVREFRLQHARAAEVKDLLEEFLGIKEKDTGPMTPQQMQMMQQRMQMMQQQSQRQGGAGAGDKKKDEIALIANLRENSVIAQAPPDRMAVIEQTVKMLDVPRQTDQTLLRNMSRMQVYRTAQLDPEVLVTMLTDLGELDPQTRLEVDKKHHSIIAYASLADHLTIRMVIEKLDGSDRKFEVIRLRRLEADFVAGTIRFMMGGEEDEDQSRRSRYRYYYYDFGSNEEEESTGKFRVDADVENNRLLLWANEIELAEIENLLVKLGEMPSKEANPSTIRVLDLSDEQAEELLKRLRQTWPRVGPNPLIVTPPATEPPATPQDNPPVLKNIDAALHTPALPRTGGADGPFTLAQFRRVVDGPAESAAAPIAEPAPGTATAPGRQAASPIQITRGRDGRLVFSSPDTQALTALEDLAIELTPPRRDWHVFQLKHRTTWAWSVAMNLEDFFKVDEQSKSGSDYNPFWGYYPSSQTESSPARLSKRRPLKFIPDDDSQTILVQGADDEQLKVIQELIELYDKPESHESASVRTTKIFYLQHSKAKPLAMAVKDVYRDLLSTNDPALQQNRPQGGDKQQPQPERSYTYIFGDQGNGKEPPEPPIKFKGLLSIGVDEQSNALIVSAPNNLLTEVGELIESLDQAAVASSITKVVPVDPAEVRRRLEYILGTSARPAPGATARSHGAPASGGTTRRFTVSRTGDRRSGDAVGQATPK